MKTLEEFLDALPADRRAEVEAGLEREQVWIARLPWKVVEADRAWRAARRARDMAPVSTKVAYYNPKVEATVAPKPRGRGK